MIFKICEQICEKTHFVPYLNFDIVISIEIIGNQLSLTACFILIAFWILAPNRSDWPAVKSEKEVGIIVPVSVSLRL